jgi:hypothetical protein
MYSLYTIYSVINATLHLKIRNFIPPPPHDMFRPQRAIIRCLNYAPLAHVGSPLADFSTLKMKAIRSPETSVNARSTQRHIPEDDILHSSSYSSNWIFYCSGLGVAFVHTPVVCYVICKNSHYYYFDLLFIVSCYIVSFCIYFFWVKCTI